MRSVARGLYIFSASFCSSCWPVSVFCSLCAVAVKLMLLLRPRSIAASRAVHSLDGPFIAWPLLPAAFNYNHEFWVYENFGLGFPLLCSDHLLRSGGSTHWYKELGKQNIDYQNIPEAFIFPGGDSRRMLSGNFLPDEYLSFPRLGVAAAVLLLSWLPLQELLFQARPFL